MKGGEWVTVIRYLRRNRCLLYMSSKPQLSYWNPNFVCKL